MVASKQSANTYKYGHNLEVPCAVVTALLCRQPGHKAFLVMPELSVNEYGRSAIDFYCSKGLMINVSWQLVAPLAYFH